MAFRDSRFHLRLELRGQNPCTPILGEDPRQQLPSELLDVLSAVARIVLPLDGVAAKANDPSFPSARYRLEAPTPESSDLDGKRRIGSRTSGHHQPDSSSQPAALSALRGGLLSYRYSRDTRDFNGMQAMLLLVTSRPGRLLPGCGSQPDVSEILTKIEDQLVSGHSHIESVDIPKGMSAFMEVG